MAKRFTDTEIWDKAWFMSLSPTHKCLLKYIFDKCDAAGVWSPNWTLASTYIGAPVTEKDLEVFNGQFEIISPGKIFIPSFIEFQYGKLSKDCKPHLPVYRLLQKHGIDVDAIKMQEGVGKTHNVSDRVRKSIFEMDGYTCCYCGKEKEERNLVIDHVVSRKRGGTDKPDNLVASCAACNIKKSDLSLEDFCNRHGLDYEIISERVAGRLSDRVSDTLKEKEQDKEKEKEEDKEKERDDAPKKKSPSKLVIDEGKISENKKEYDVLVEEVNTQSNITDAWLKIKAFIAEKKPQFIEPFVDLWNIFASKNNLHRIEAITQKRKEKFRTRVREPGFDFIKILEAIKKSDFYLGKDSSTWKVDFDFILHSEDNYIKILERNR